jgi:hypothetical protein
MDMTEDSRLFDDQEFERLVREFDRQKDRGVSGLVDRIRIFRDAHKSLEPERFDRFCETVDLLHRIERDLLHHFGRRLEELDSILGSQLEAYGVFHLLMTNRSEFEAVTEHAALCSDHARCLLGNFVDGLVSQVNRMKPGDPDKDIYGMTWKTGKPPLRAIDDE